MWIKQEKRRLQAFSKGLPHEQQTMSSMGDKSKELEEAQSTIESEFGRVGG